MTLSYRCMKRKRFLSCRLNLKVQFKYSGQVFKFLFKQFTYSQGEDMTGLSFAKGINTSRLS